MDKLPGVINNGYQCVDCHDRVEFAPSLADRGMTVKQAHALFVAPKGGRCVACYNAKYLADTLVLIKRMG